MKSPAFQFYPNDWLSSRAVRLMDDQQRGWYWQLLVESWVSDPQCSLPDDIHQLYILSGASDEANFNTRCDLVLSQFTKRNGLLWHDRLLEEYAKQQLHKQKCSRGGKKSAASRRIQKRKEMEVIKSEHVASLKGTSNLVASKTQLDTQPDTQPNANSSSSSSTSSSSSVISKEGGFANRLIALWCETFQRVHSKKYGVAPKDAGQAKLYAKSGMTPEEIVSIAESGWKSQDKFVRENSMSISTIGNVLNRIHVQTATAQKIHTAADHLKAMGAQEAA